MEDRPMAFTDHLTELRSKLLRSVLAVALVFFAAYAFHEELFRIVTRPVMQALRSHGIYTLQALQVTETITVYIQISLVAAVIGASPYVFYQVWSFIAPGLYRREKRYIVPIAVLTSSFFMLGVVFCYFVFLPMVVDFLVGFTVGSGDVALLPTVAKTFSFTIMFPIVFGLLFQLPLLMFFLSLLGVVDHGKFLRFGRYFIVLSFALGALFTPPDPLSQGLMSIPICLLYFAGVAFAWVAGLLRNEGTTGVLPKVMATVIVVAFSILVVSASYIWNRSGSPPAYGAHVPAEASYVLKANPSSVFGRSALLAAEVPDGLLSSSGRPEAVFLVGGTGDTAWLAWGDDFPCPRPPSHEDGPCVVQGTWSGPDSTAEPSSRHSDLDRDKWPVVMVAGADCLLALLPLGVELDGEKDLVVRVASEPIGLVRLEFEFTASSRGRESLAAWIVAVRERWVPERVPQALFASPMGRVLAWSEGDLELRHTEESVVVSMAVTSGRASRILEKLIRGIVKECSPTPRTDD